MTRIARKLQKSFADPKHAAHSAGLRHVTDVGPGIRRVRHGDKFSYKLPNGRPVTDPDTLIRIRALAIPPAWREVWICPHSNGHLQAVGLDARGRKQYRYHANWRAHRDLAKYTHIIEFARKLPEIRARTRRDLRKHGLPREKVLAATVRILEKTLIRIGNEQYTRENKTFGLTTLKDHHAKINGAKVVFDFRGKHGVHRNVGFHDPKLAEIVRKCRDLDGEELFQYVDDDGNVCDINNTDVNNYLREISGEAFTAKDFRTWAGTVLTANALQQMALADSQRQLKRNLIAAVEQTAKQLGNTTAVCRKCYIHPAVLNSYMDGSLVKTLKRRIEMKLESKQDSLGTDEQAVLHLLQSTLNRMRKLPAAA
jgi:DNA topoisomerase-1